MTAALRWYFLAFYAVGLTVLIVKVVPQGRKDGPIENRPGGRCAAISSSMRRQA